MRVQPAGSRQSRARSLRRRRHRQSRRRPARSGCARRRAGCRSAAVPGAAARDAARSRGCAAPPRAASRRRSRSAARPPHRRGRDTRRPRRVGPRQQAALRPRVPRTGGDVIGVEQVGELARRTPDSPADAAQQELLEEPGGVRAVPFGRARVRHRLHDLVLGRQRRRAALGLAAHGAEGSAPKRARIGAADARDVAVTMVTEGGCGSGG